MSTKFRLTYLQMKKETLVMIGMGLCTVAVIAIIVGGVQSSANDDTKELQLLHVVVRHGARTPVDTYPNDPHINDTLFPVGWGHLTNEGKLELYNLGKFLRQRYGKFLGDLYSPDEYYAQSTDVDRTIASVQLLNAGLWIPAPLQQWGPLDWQPIPVHYEPLKDDSLLLVRKPCAEYSLELERVEALPEIKAQLKANEVLFKYLENVTGKKVKSFEDVQDIYTTLQAEVAYNLTLPPWTKGYFPEKMQEAAAFSYVLNAYTDKLNRLKGGVLLKKLIEDWTNKVDGTLKPSKRKAFLYGAHDSTIANLLSALKVFDAQVPGYGVAVMLEFSKDRITNRHGLEVYFKNSTSSAPHKLQLPGCESFCPIENVVELTKNVVPGDWSKECTAEDPNYVPRQPSGP